MKKKKKLILILSGGGAKGAFQVGAWNRIVQQGLQFGDTRLDVKIPDAVFGISAGALNGAMIAMGKFRDLLKLWNQIAGNPQEIYTSQFLKTEGDKVKFDTDALMKYLTDGLSFIDKSRLMFKRKRKKTIKKIMAKLLELDSLSSNVPLACKLSELISISDIKSEVFKAGFVSLTDGKYHSLRHDKFPNDQELQKAVLASASLPMIWSPVSHIQTKDFELSHLIDGGIRDTTPLGDAVRYIHSCGDDAQYHFVIISCHTPSLEVMEKKPNLFSIAERTLYDIALNEVQNSDLSEFLRINELVEQAEKKGCELFSKSGRKLKSYKVQIIRPERKLKGGLDFTRSAVMDSFAHGYEVAKKATC